MKIFGFAVVLTAALSAMGLPAQAADPTVESLLGQGYAAVAAITSPIGPGVFLEKGASLYLCFISVSYTHLTLPTIYSV